MKGTTYSSFSIFFYLRNSSYLSDRNLFQPEIVRTQHKNPKAHAPIQSS